MKRGHANFLPADSVHLFANDVLNLGEDPEPKRQVGVDAGHLFVHVARADKQLGILGHLVSRSLAPRPRK